MCVGRNSDQKLISEEHPGLTEGKKIEGRDTVCYKVDHVARSVVSCETYLRGFQKTLLPVYFENEFLLTSCRYPRAQV